MNVFLTIQRWINWLFKKDSSKINILSGEMERYLTLWISRFGSEPAIFLWYTYIVATYLFYFTPGTEWRTIRNIVNPGFRSNILSLFDDNFTYHTRAFVDRLEKYENSDEFDIFVPVHLCTIDLISGEFKPSSSIPEETPIILFVYWGYLVKNNGHPRT